MIDEERYWTSDDYKAGYLVGETERVTLATENDRLRHELAILEKLYRQLEKSGD